MSAAALARARQERAQELAARGDLEGAVKLMDAWLAANDGDWGVWLYLANLCGRLGRRDQAAAAYCASARQLETDGFFARARAAVVCASQLLPSDPSLAREVVRLARLSGQLSPAADAAPSNAETHVLRVPVAKKVIPKKPAARPASQPLSAALVETGLIRVRKNAKPAPAPATSQTSLIEVPPLVTPAAPSRSETSLIHHPPSSPQSASIRVRKSAKPTPLPDSCFEEPLLGGRPGEKPATVLQRPVSAAVRAAIAAPAAPARARPASPNAPRALRASVADGHTDPHCPIFEILDDEARLVPRRGGRR